MNVTKIRTALKRTAVPTIINDVLNLHAGKDTPCEITCTPAVEAVKPLASKLDDAIEHPLYVNTLADSWVTEQCKGAIRIARACPPFAFGEDVAAVHPTLPGLARDLVARYNACASLPTDMLELAGPGRIAELLDERAELLALLRDFVKASELGLGMQSKRLYLDRMRAAVEKTGRAAAT